LALGLAVLFIIYVILFSVQFGPYLPTEYWIRDVYILKHHIAKDIKEKKIVIISGSSGLFGVDSSLIEDITGIKTLNMSTHAGLTLDFILEPRKLFLKKGDIAVLPLEFECYRQETLYNDLTIEAVITWDRKYYDHLSLWKKIEFISSCSPLRVAAALFQKYVRRQERYSLTPAKIIAAAKASWAKSDNKLKPGPIYQNIDRYGDIIHNKGTTNKVKAVGYGGMGSPGWEITSYSKKAISAFVNYCRENEIQVFFTWPSTLKSKQFDLNNKIIQGNLTKIKRFLSHLAVPVLGEPGDFHFERKYFFDTHYHLNQTGREIRTRRLINHLPHGMGNLLLKNYKLQNTNYKQITNYNVQNYKQLRHVICHLSSVICLLIFLGFRPNRQKRAGIKNKILY
jgi:hypothetical protein